MRLSAVRLVRMKDVAELTKLYSNLPESYIKRSLERIEHLGPRGLPNFRPVTMSRKAKYFGLHRPWTEAYWRENDSKGHPKVFVEPLGTWSVFKGDQVEVLAGPDKGKRGIVVQVIQERNWVIVEGMNTKLTLIGKTKEFPGTVMREEQPLLFPREVCLVDPSDLQATSVEWRYTEEGEHVRVSVRTGRIIPLPVQAKETYDYKTKRTYKESPKDTTDKLITQVTFQPKLATFEMDIMKSMGIKEDRVPALTFWY